MSERMQSNILTYRNIVSETTKYGGNCAVLRSQWKLVRLTVVWLFVSPAMITIVEPCRVDYCLDEKARLMDEHVILARRSADYCHVLDGYIACLNKTARACHSRIDFHSAITAARQRWRRFRCAEQPPPAPGLYAGSHDTCAFWPETFDKPIHCAIFGRAMHLRAFGSVAGIERCTFAGTRPLLDNRFFVVQLSAAVDSELAGTVTAGDPYYSVSKVVVLIKSNNRCVKHQRVYEANAESPLPTTFTDGSAEIVDRTDFAKKVAEVLTIDPTTVQIRLHYLRMVVTVRRGDRFLSVFIDAPQRILHTSYDGMPSAQLCYASTSAAVELCDEKAVTRFYEALARPRLFQNCVLARPTDKLFDDDEAIKSCAGASLFGEYFDACVFDLLLSTASGFRVETIADASQLAQTLGAAAAEFVANELVTTSTSYEDERQDNGVSAESPDHGSFEEESMRQSLDVYASNDDLVAELELECGITPAPRRLSSKHDKYNNNKIHNKSDFAGVDRQKFGATAISLALCFVQLAHHLIIAHH